MLRDLNSGNWWGLCHVCREYRVWLMGFTETESTVTYILHYGTRYGIVCLRLHCVTPLRLHTKIPSLPYQTTTNLFGTGIEDTQSEKRNATQSCGEGVKQTHALIISFGAVLLTCRFAYFSSLPLCFSLLHLWLGPLRTAIWHRRFLR